MFTRQAWKKSIIRTLYSKDTHWVGSVIVLLFWRNKSTDRNILKLEKKKKLKKNQFIVCCCLFTWKKMKMLAISFDYFIKLGILTEDAQWTSRLRALFISVFYLSIVGLGFNGFSVAYGLKHLSDDFVNALISMSACFAIAMCCLKYCLFKISEEKVKCLMKAFNDLAEHCENLNYFI